MIERYYIYALICPDEQVVKYIGNSTNIKNRLHGHISASKKGKTDKDKWILALKNNNKKPQLVVISETNDRRDAFRLERMNIMKYRQTIYNTTKMYKPIIADFGSYAEIKRFIAVANLPT